MEKIIEKKWLGVRKLRKILLCSKQIATAIYNKSIKERISWEQAYNFLAKDHNLPELDENKIIELNKKPIKITTSNFDYMYGERFNNKKQIKKIIPINDDNNINHKKLEIFRKDNWCSK